MAITLKVGDGIQYDGFENIRVFRSLETIAGEFEFQASIQNPADFPIKLGDSCAVFVNGIQVIDGFIEKLSCETSAFSHSIFISGRDKTADVIDSSVFENIEFNNSIKLVDVIKQILVKNNITGIDVLDTVGDITVFSKEDLISSEIGENVFELIEKYCRKRQVLCTTDGNGNISLERASETEIARYLLSELGNEENNLKSINFTLDNSARFNKVLVKSQGNPILGNISGDNLVNITGISIDPEIRDSRINVIMSDTALTIDPARNMAAWYVNIASARSINASLSIQGFSFDENDSTKIWIPNRLINIKDDFWNIDAKMLIKSVEYTFGLDGSITNLELTNRDAYTLEAQEEEIFKKNENSGDDLIKKLSQG